MEQKKDTYFLELAKNNFGDLLEDDGFVIIDYGYNPVYFGDAYVTFQSSEFLIRLLRSKGQVLLEIGLFSLRARSYDLAQIVSFLDPKSNWSYKSPDDNNQLFSSTEWKIGEVRRIFEQYRTQLLDLELYTNRKQELEQFIKAKYVDPWLRKSG